MSAPRVAIFGPHPLLTVTIEARPPGGDDVHVHAGGQGVWVARMAGELGAQPVLCALVGGETGRVLRALLGDLPGERRLVETASPSGSYVMDRRDGERRLLAQRLADSPTRHELDELFSRTLAAALESRVLCICNPYPGGTLPLELYGALVQDARGNDVPVIADLSSPRLDSALEGRPDLVKMNDWELAQYVSGPVGTTPQLVAAAERLLEAGARAALVTRAAEPALLLAGERRIWIETPRFERGAREGCGDSMFGGIAAGLARGLELEEAVRLGAAAGATNFLRHGLSTGSRPVVEEMLANVVLTPL